MSLDLSKTAAQLSSLTQNLFERESTRASALQQALAAFEQCDPASVESRRLVGKVTWLIAGLDGKLDQAISRPLLPVDHTVVSVDGSHIDVDRHSPARCYLINIGHVSLRYGEQPSAQLWSTPSLYASDADLMLTDPAKVRSVPVEGQLLGMKRAVLETEALVDLVEDAPPDLPVVALLDGSLILWGLTGQAYPDFVRETLLNGGLLPALDRLRAAAAQRPLAIASYVSHPRSTDVVNALRLHACPYDPVNCDAHCGGLALGSRACDIVGGLTDAELYSAALNIGERSVSFRSTSHIMDYYGSHAVSFFYLNTGEEIARVELPTWCAQNPTAIDLLHAGLLAQAEKGLGYPLALQEAHEQAVVSANDRALFDQLVNEALTDQGLPIGMSEKARSKRTRFI